MRRLDACMPDLIQAIERKSSRMRVADGWKREESRLRAGAPVGFPPALLVVSKAEAAEGEVGGVPLALALAVARGFAPGAPVAVELALDVGGEAEGLDPCGQVATYGLVGLEGGCVRG